MIDKNKYMTSKNIAITLLAIFVLYKLIKYNSRCDCKSDHITIGKLFPILDPRFNLREVSKQCILLEDHLNNEKKRCNDCIKKHFLFIDGLLEEAVSLEQNEKNKDVLRKLFLEWIDIEKEYALNDNQFDETSKKIRMFRKPLMNQYFKFIEMY